MDTTTGASVTSTSSRPSPFTARYPTGSCPPHQPPWAALRSMPAMTRSMMVARSNSANTPSIWTIMRPAAAWVSKGSVADLKATPTVSRSSITWARPRTLRESRSVRYTSRTSKRPALAWARARRSPGRSRLAPESWSVKLATWLQPSWLDM
ncbi:MAG TPA: hypothetical protein VN799_09355 [Acidimicrobiales bacterium]|nr:hypothetical protein [Acidimicrobiales bacterium]